ncbi:uncharacterized protein [Aegilops tauschii subsp. strangulata]|uniref:uncharacterized protein n=1 Tax=Aegilops tauschii subsp. strangulata TaxID=200361 RepID=UPI001ABCE532|nr:uncharacterized protein LOC109746308 isoform X2 [Aegilops tauschii subsp. strangulata]XP_044331901.1 uncharacterized protein LOC123052661 isoform X2 [Triticum aestivum]
MPSSAHSPPAAPGGDHNRRHRWRHAIHTTLVLHWRSLQVRAQVGAVGRGGQAAPPLPQVPRSADINPVVQHRVPKIGTPPPNRPGPAPWQRAYPPTLTFNFNGRSHHDLAAPLVEPASLGEQSSRWPSRFRPAGRGVEALFPRGGSEVLLIRAPSAVLEHHGNAKRGGRS